MMTNEIELSDFVRECRRMPKMVSRLLEEIDRMQAKCIEADYRARAFQEEFVGLHEDKGRLVKIITDLQKRVESLEVIERLWIKACDCMDKVFQESFDRLGPMFPYYCAPGESKFDAMVRLARDYRSLLDRWNDTRRVS